MTIFNEHDLFRKPENPLEKHLVQSNEFYGKWHNKVSFYGAQASLKLKNHGDLKYQAFC